MVVSNLKQMLQDQSGVSAVIGVIMMVAVTVVMAGIVGAFVFGVGSDLNQPVPQTQVNFVFDGDTGDVYIYHDGGEILTDGNTGRLTISGDLDSNDGTWGLGYNDGVKEESPSTEIGDKIWETTTPLSSGDEIVLSWESNNGKKSSKLGTFEAP